MVTGQLVSRGGTGRRAEQDGRRRGGGAVVSGFSVGQQGRGMAPAISGARRDREKGEPLRRLKVGSGSSGGGERERTGSAPALPVRFFSFSAARPSLTL